MKYIGYVLFATIFALVAFMPAARAFFLESWSLAPEITALVAIAYIYVVGLTVVVSLFPNVSKHPSSLYDTHVKMACSVMVSLGLVGTFLGLVDMIAGIGKALSSGESDFSARMVLLLEAISSSLGAMSFAFMTSILGVGISAYSMIAGTFVLSSLKEADKSRKQAATEAPGIPLVDLVQRLSQVETEMAKMRVISAEQGIMPQALLHEVVQQGAQAEQKNQQMIEQISAVSQQFANVASALNEISGVLARGDRNTEVLFEQLQRIEQNLVNSNTQLSSLGTSLNAVKGCADDFSQRVRQAFS